MYEQKTSVPVYNFRISGQGQGNLMVVHDLELVTGCSTPGFKERRFTGLRRIKKKLRTLGGYNEEIGELVNIISNSSILLELFGKDGGKSYFLIPEYKETAAVVPGPSDLYSKWASKRPPYNVQPPTDVNNHSEAKSTNMRKIRKRKRGEKV